MKPAALDKLSVAQLVDRFAAIGIQQYEAHLIDDTAGYKPLFWQMVAIEKELKSRPGDQRRALLPLFEHPNMEVRLKAAKATLAIAPKQARQIVESIAASRCFPQAGDAGMCLEMLDRGIFVPD
jgi:cytochrome c oxidase assembly protein Cox11